MDKPSSQKFPIKAAELRKLVRRVTITNLSTGKVGTIDTLAHINRQVQLGRLGDKPIREYVVDGVQFKHRGQTEFDIKVAEIPEDQDHHAYDVVWWSEDGMKAAIV